mmetsp:Transcript_95999/g.273696  ORF Transcript_95999/g.273696 Transcript_95999/m.273696 type:complete len:249 (-) Transcript_95999:532-1278(-)
MHLVAHPCIHRKGTRQPFGERNLPALLPRRGNHDERRVLSFTFGQEGGDAHQFVKRVGELGHLRVDRLEQGCVHVLPRYHRLELRVQGTEQLRPMQFGSFFTFERERLYLRCVRNGVLHSLIRLVYTSFHFNPLCRFFFGHARQIVFQRLQFHLGLLSGQPRCRSFSPPRLHLCRHRRKLNGFFTLQLCLLTFKPPRRLAQDSCALNSRLRQSSLKKIRGFGRWASQLIRPFHCFELQITLVFIASSD